MKNKTSEMLNMLRQEHIVKHMQTLTEPEQYAMVRQIESLDLSVLDAQESEEKRGTFAPLFATTLAEIEQNRERYTQIGLQAIRNGKIGAVLLAGGQGSRLGFDHPKGMFRIGIDRELYIFECLINNLLDVVKQMRGFRCLS